MPRRGNGDPRGLIEDARAMRRRIGTVRDWPGLLDQAGEPRREFQNVLIDDDHGEDRDQP